MWRQIFFQGAVKTVDDASCGKMIDGFDGETEHGVIAFHAGLTHHWKKSKNNAPANGRLKPFLPARLT